MLYITILLIFNELFQFFLSNVLIRCFLKLMFNISFCKMMSLINLHPLKHSYVQFFCESNFALILEFAIFYHFRHICIKKSYIFSKFLIISGLNACYFDYLMISYWFDINILSKIKLHMSQNGYYFFKISKNGKKNISAQSDTAIFE